MADYMSNFRERQGVLHFNTLTGGDPMRISEKLLLLQKLE